MKAVRRATRAVSVRWMDGVRPAAVAGLFYPADPDQLRSTVANLLDAEPAATVDVDPRIVVVPHAGYVYSGIVAAAAYRLLMAPAASDRIVLIGPAHFVRFPGIATPGVSAMATPLGRVATDPELTARAEQQSAVTAAPAPHRKEHSLEVQLPFLQSVFAACTVTPLVTGDVTGTTAGEVLDALLEPGVIGVISSDLSHYFDYETAREKDERTATAMVDLDADAIRPEDACGRTALQAGLFVAARRDWACRQLALANSGDTAGSRDRVVGYGAFVIGPPA